MNHITASITRCLLLSCLAASARAVPPAPELGWLAGHWCQQKGDELVEEHWLPPLGGMMLSAGRTTQAGATRAFEFLRLEFKDGKVAFIAQPNGAPPTRFALTAWGAGWVRFENPAHDFPKRVEYRRTPGGLHAQIAGPGQGGAEQVIGFDYLPCAAGSY
jgi:hypothetical protein